MKKYKKSKDSDDTLQMFDTSFKQREVDLCPEHQKDLEIYCQECFKWICYKCGLFGLHKGHNLIN